MTLRPLPPPLTLTEAAKARVQALTADKPDKVGLRVGLRTAGCSGLAYTAELADSVNPTDLVIEVGTAKLLIDRKAELYLIGTVMDYISTPLKSGFEFINPNEAARCGCGESFTPREDIKNPIQ